MQGQVTPKSSSKDKNLAMRSTKHVPQTLLSYIDNHAPIGEL